MVGSEGSSRFEMASELFALLSAPTRLKIVDALMQAESNVTQILERVAVSQPNVSQHLGVLYRSGVVARRRRGNQVYYRIVDERVRQLCAALCGPARSPAPAARGSGTSRRPASDRTPRKETP